MGFKHSFCPSPAVLGVCPDEKLIVATALMAATDDLQARADGLRRDAKTFQRQAKRWADLIRDTGAAPHLVNLLKAKGSDDPITEAAAMLDALPEFVAAHYEHFNKHVSDGTKRRRNREIVRLARRLTNKEISARTGLSSRQIQRILKIEDLGDYA